MLSNLKNRRVQVLVGIGVVLVAALVVGAVSVFGGDDKSSSKYADIIDQDPQPENPRFHTAADARPFASQAPMTTRFFSRPFNADGKVSYYWRFDDGTTSKEQNPIHKFVEAGTYTVFIDTHDSSGHKDRYTLILGAWPPDVWQTAQRRRLTKREQFAAIRQQAARTKARHKRLRAQGKGNLVAGD